MFSHDPQSQITYRGKRIAVEEVAERKINPNVLGRSAGNTETLLCGENGRYYLRRVWGWNAPPRRVLAKDPLLQRWRAMPNKKFTEEMMIESRDQGLSTPIFRYRPLRADQALLWRSMQPPQKR
ncbi:MAG: hypothetical protein ACR2ID_10140 [Chthoniobacterales bacterium]